MSGMNGFKPWSPADEGGGDLSPIAAIAVVLLVYLVAGLFCGW